MDPIRKALQAYRIEAVTIDRVTEKLFCVYDGKQVFALKKSMMTKDQIRIWQNVYHQAYSQNLSGILSVYLTANGNLYEEVDGVFYYITPWLQLRKLNQKQELENLYRTIGSIHAKTKQTVTSDVERIKSQFKQFQEYCLNINSSLIGYVEKFEKNRFMAPFELLVCTQYRELAFFLNELNKQIEYFLDEIDEQSAWNYSLCHGQLKSSHVLHSHNTYLTNWEKAFFDNAVIDLSAFFTDLVKYYDQPTDQLINLFSVYSNENSLTNSELYLLCIYLFDPSNYIKIIKQYADKTSTDSMPNQVCDLQYAYRRLVFAMKFTEHVNSISVSSIEEFES